MNDKEKKAIKYFYNLRATIDESYMLFDEGINVKCEKEMIKQISTILNLIEKQKAEIEKKDNIIDKIVYYLSDFDIDEMCGKCDKCIGNGCYADDDIEFKINCIKKYFEKESRGD